MFDLSIFQLNILAHVTCFIVVGADIKLNIELNMSCTLTDCLVVLVIGYQLVHHLDWHPLHDIHSLILLAKRVFQCMRFPTLQRL